MKLKIALACILLTSSILLGAVTKTDLESRDIKGNVKKVETDYTIEFYLSNGMLDYTEEYTDYYVDEYDDGYDGGIDYHYDDAGRLVKMISFDFMDVVTSKDEYTYDAAGNMISKLYTYGQNETLESNSYDAKGNLIQSIYTDQYQNLMKTIHYTYDASGRKLSLLQKDPEGKQKEKQTFSYDKAGNLTLHTFYDALNTITQEFTYKYDAQNRVIESKYDPKLPDKYTAFKHSYNAEGFIAETITTEMPAKTSRTKKYTYKVDAQGNWTTKTTTESDGTVHDEIRYIAYY